MANLCTLADLKKYLNIAPGPSTDDDVLSRLVAARSADFMREINRTDFAPAADYTEVREGDGAAYLALKHYPVNSIKAVKVGELDAHQRVTIPAEDPYTVQVTQHDDFYQNLGVVLEDGTGSFDEIETGTPQQGEYLVDPATGTYTFAEADQDEDIVISYAYDNRLPASTDRRQPGYWIDSDLDPERRWELFLVDLVFDDLATVTVEYNAGYGDRDVDDEPWAIPADPGPYQVVPQQQQRFSADRGVKYQESGDDLVKVSGPPAAGQYKVNPDGTYIFAAADAGTVVLISYGVLGVPDDVQQAVVEWAAYSSKERTMPGQTSRHLAMGETVSFQQITMPLNTARAIERYRRAFPPREKHDATGAPVAPAKGSVPGAIRTQDEFGL